MKINKKRVIILILIIINLTILIILMSLRGTNKSENITNETEKFDYKDIDFDKEVKNEYISEGKILPDGFTFLTRFYEGNVSDEYVYKKIYSMVYEIIPEMYDETHDLDQNELSKYFNTNKNNIIDKIGITEESDFIEFVRKLKEDCNLNNYESIFNFENYIVEGDYGKIKLDIVYKNTILSYDMYIASDKDSINPIIKFIPQN